VKGRREICGKRLSEGLVDPREVFLGIVLLEGDEHYVLGGAEVEFFGHLRCTPPESKHRPLSDALRMTILAFQCSILVFSRRSARNFGR